MKKKQSRIKTKRITLIPVVLSIASVFVLALLILFFGEKPKVQSLQSPIPIKTKASFLASALSPFPTPTATPSPTLVVATIAPTKAAPPSLSGYCLTVPVLFYHHIQPYAQAKAKFQTSLSVDNGVFDSQMQYLSTKGYNGISAKQLVDALKNHTALASKSIVVSFDDGYKDTFTYAFPILNKYHIQANLMLASGLIGGADYLSWSDVEALAHSGLFYFTDHTWSHYSVGRGGRDKIKFEIETARTQIEEHTGQKVDIFTYPYGTSSNLAIEILQEDGFSGAFTTIPGMVQCDSFLYTLHRTRVGNSPLFAYGL